METLPAPSSERVSESFSKKVRTRIAPSPTGSPHIGTIYTALFNYVFAKKNKGEFVLRIEDTDQSRKVEGSEEEIVDSLGWLGLIPDEGPKTKDKFGPYRQSERLKTYEKYIYDLIASRNAYYCNCSQERLGKIREEQQARGEAPRYDRKCRFNPPEESQGCVVRLAIPLDGNTLIQDEIRGEIKFENKNIDDQVLLKSDGFPTYHLASVVDDHLMEISHVIRAEEWLTSTPKHVILYKAFGWKAPVFAHLPLLRNKDRSKISKRKNPVSVVFYKNEGYLPEALLNFLALLGWSMPNGEEIFNLKAMVQSFDLKRVDPSGPIFDIEKLDWLNGHYIRKTESKELVKRLKEYSKYTAEQIKTVLPLVTERLKKLSEFDSLTSYFFEDEVEIDLTLLTKVSGKNQEQMNHVLKNIETILSKIENWSKENLENSLHTLPETLGWSRTELFQTIRIVETGNKASPPLFETLELIGKEKTLKRLKKVQTKLSE